MRATVPDRPGALARLAQECGAASANILGLEVFPGVDLVTDELVLRTSRQVTRRIPAAAEAD